MAASYHRALAPGTNANKKKQAEEYLHFALLYKVPYLAPSLTHICMYAQLLANKHAAPGSIKNYLSGAKSWLSEHGGSVASFASPQLSQLVKGLTKNSGHIPTQAPPLGPHHVRAICDFLDASPAAPLAIKPALLIRFSCFLRASNLLSPSMAEWGGPHTLLGMDVRLSPAGLTVFIRSTKTRSDPKGLAFSIPANLQDRYCPVAAYKSVVNPWPLGPAFLLQNNLPLTPRHVVGIMRLALKDHRDIDASRISMHSLRRGATHTAVDQGVDLQTVQSRGTWKSAAGMKPYLPDNCRLPTTVPVSNLAN